ncbi:hypothetical protein E4N81_04010 [Treponema denticola]|uniref:hypothetical protein n=1 Tax=Treponema denticola TaxID=158 RepID=UPI003D6E24C0
MTKIDSFFDEILEIEFKFPVTLYYQTYNHTKELYAKKFYNKYGVKIFTSFAKTKFHDLTKIEKFLLEWNLNPKYKLSLSESPFYFSQPNKLKILDSNNFMKLQPANIGKKIKAHYCGKVIYCKHKQQNILETFLAAYFKTRDPNIEYKLRSYIYAMIDLLEEPKKENEKEIRIIFQ